MSRWAFLWGSVIKNLSANVGAQIWSLGLKDTLEKEKATHSSILAWRIPWTEKPGAWCNTVHGVTKSLKWWWLSTYTPSLVFKILVSSELIYFKYLKWYIICIMKSLNCPRGVLAFVLTFSKLLPCPWMLCVIGLFWLTQELWVILNGLKNVTSDGALVHVIWINLETEISHVHNQSINHVYTMEH